MIFCRPGYSGRSKIVRKNSYIQSRIKSFSLFSATAKERSISGYATFDWQLQYAVRDFVLDILYSYKEVLIWRSKSHLCALLNEIKKGSLTRNQSFGLPCC